MTDPLQLPRPNDIDAEMAVLGACMHSAEALKQVMDLVAPGDYYRPAHEKIHTLMQTMTLNRTPVDQRTLTAAVTDAGLMPAHQAFDYVYQMFNAVPSAANIDWYISIVINRSQRRELIETGTRAVQAGLSVGDDDDPTTMIEQVVEWFRTIRDRSNTGRTEAVDIHDFLAVETRYNWLVPGLLEWGDRMILTASEGGGKTTMIRQIAICVSAGLHPFTQKHTDPQKVLYIDLENSEEQSRRALYPLAGLAARAERPIARGMFSIRCRPEGLDLTQQRDRSWLLREVEAFQPGLLIVGPVYRLHTGNPNDEELARKVSVVIDQCRAITGCAVIMEAHAPHGSGQGPRVLRPIGSTLWMRWPEFGYGLRPVDDMTSATEERMREVVPWRGARDARDWPEFVRQGIYWPWQQHIPGLSQIQKPQGATW